MSYEYKYPRMVLVVDAVVFGISDRDLKLLLIKRAIPPSEGSWALPGGHVEMPETTLQAAQRELEEETGVKDCYLEQLYTFDQPDRDPRDRVVSVAYYGLIPSDSQVLRPETDAEDAQWFAVSELPELAFDHAQIIKMALNRLRAKIRYAPVGFELLPEAFTLTQLQELYETILQRNLDKRNFRKKILSTGLLEELDQKAKTIPPARLYSFNMNKYQELTKQGFNFEL